MPPRSLLLNVSITAKGIDEREKIQVVDSVKEVEVEVEDIKIDQDVKEGRQARIDSAASIQTSPLHDIATIPDNAITTSPSESDPCTIPTPLDSPIALSPEPALHLLQCASCGFINFPDTSTPTTLRRCSRCKVQRYCSRQCQKSHWPVHKRTCTPPTPEDTGFPTTTETSSVVEAISVASPPCLSSSSSPSPDVEMTGMSTSYCAPSDVSSPGTMSSMPVSREWTPERV